MSEKTLPLLRDVKQIYIDSLEAFYNKDEKKAHKVMEEGKVIWDKCIKMTNSDNVFLSLIGEKLKNVENASYQIVKMILNMREENGRTK